MKEFIYKNVNLFIFLNIDNLNEDLNEKTSTVDYKKNVEQEKIEKDLNILSHKNQIYKFLEENVKL